MAHSSRLNSNGSIACHVSPKTSRRRHAGAAWKGLSRKGSLFVIHKHHARNLHYDLRLELDGVLKSWAVPKGPSLDPRVKRLAIEVEDHPVQYGGFEGNIPEGEYGAGAVIIWDRGTWEPLEDPHEGLRHGKLRFELHGEKLHGESALVAVPAKRAKQPQWLLIKIKDAEARPGDGAAITEELPQSVVSRRTVEEAAASLPAKKQPKAIDERAAKVVKAIKSVAAASSKAKSPAASRFQGIRGAKPAAMPRSVELELATLVKQPPEGDEWFSEVKLDGYRIACHIAKGKASLFSRTHKDWTARFQAVAAEAGRLPVKQAILDGEIAVFLAKGRTSFQALQNTMREEHGGSLTYAVFDLLYLDGYDLRGAALEDRKQLLAEILAGKEGSVQYLEHFVGQAGRFYRQCCKRGLEGAICKRRTRPYLAGRGVDWLKAKCLLRQEFVIGGYTDSTNKQRPFGALLVGYFEKPGKLAYAGRVGTGWEERTMAALAEQLRPLTRSKSPFDSPVDRADGKLHWVQPKLVAEIAFSQWTRDGRLRQPSFQGLREDKPAAKVVREEPAT